MSKHRKSERSGAVLLLVLVVTAVLTLATLAFAELMLAEHRAVIAAGRQAQARALADSGVEMIKQFLIQDSTTQQESGGWFENPTYFRAVLVADDTDSRYRGRFTVLSANTDDSGETTLNYGLENESGRLNLALVMAAEARQANTGRTMLMQLPAMTEDVADAILDWLDADSNPRQMGAEADYYSQLTPGYAPKNGPIDNIEELLLVRGVTPELLFGADRNRNGQIDADEQLLVAAIAVDSTSGPMDRGWQAYLTLYSKEANLRPDGTAKINLNETDLVQLHADLQDQFGKEWADFIVAYRQFGPADEDQDNQNNDNQNNDNENNNDEQGGSNRTEGRPTDNYSVDPQQPATTTLTSVLDLIGVRIEIDPMGNEEGAGNDGPMNQPGGGGNNEDEQDNPMQIVLESPFDDAPEAMRDYLPELLDHVTINPVEVIPARINVNLASQSVLMAVPGMTPEVADAIIARRSENPLDALSEQRHETWILQEGLVDLEEMRELMPYLTTGGAVFRGQVVGFFDEPGIAVRAEVVIDASGTAPRQLFWRDLSNLGPGYTPAMLGSDLVTPGAY